MAATIIKGHNLMLFDASGHSLAYATNHTLSISGESVDVSSKDHGIWSATEVNKINWEISSENLYTEDGFNSLFDKMIARQAIDVYFGLKSETDDTKTVVDGDYQYWTVVEPTATVTGQYKGKAYITSLTANAPDGENATFSLTLQGAGKLEREVYTPTQQS